MSNSHLPMSEQRLNNRARHYLVIIFSDQYAKNTPQAAIRGMPAVICGPSALFFDDKLAPIAALASASADGREHLPELFNAD
jgi:hypothetical protein